MALDVQCGCASKIEIVRTNGLTGEVTGVFPQTNIWTDAGLARISGYVTGNSEAYWPSRLHYGSGAHVAPHNGVKRLANRLGHGVWGGRSNATYPDLDTVLVTRTASITVGARGVAWELSELGLSLDTWPEGPVDLDTYSLTKIGGVPAPIPVAAIEILTITYTVQIQVPRRLPPMAVSISGDMPPTMATFSNNSSQENYMRSRIRGTVDNPSCVTDGKNQSGGRSGITDTFGNSTANGTITAYQRSAQDDGGFKWTFDPPFTKLNTQQLEFESYWTFTNGTYREV